MIDVHLLDAHHRLAFGTALAIIAFLLLEGRLERTSQIIAAWDIFVVVDLALAWWVIMRADPARSRKTARLQDSGRTAIFALVLFAALAAFLSVAFLFGPPKGITGGRLGLHLVLSAIAIAGSWLVVQTAFALRYAHLFYGGSNGTGKEVFHEGLRFPGTPQPDYLDFAYFAFVIGMTFQVSDVQITSRTLRRLALTHGILSFFFNVVILGLTVSVMSSLL